MVECGYTEVPRESAAGKVDSDRNTGAPSAAAKFGPAS